MGKGWTENATRHRGAEHRDDTVENADYTTQTLPKPAVYKSTQDIPSANRAVNAERAITVAHIVSPMVCTLLFFLVRGPSSL